jgi:hypothetical protein
MPGVFISYRRDDSPGHAGRVFDRVRARFGADGVFMDVAAIDAGADFVDAIEGAVGACDVLLAIIGPQWVGAADSAGRKRLDDPNDFIRLEVAGALKRSVRVVPVLVDDARLPAAADLPDDLQPLLRRNAIELRDARWDADITQLIASLERIVQRSQDASRPDARPRGRLRAFAALAAVVLSVGAAALFGPRACATAPTGSVTGAAPPPSEQRANTSPPAAQGAADVAASTPPPESPSARGGGAVAPKPAAAIPDVVGRSLPDARETLRRAGVDVARVLYRDDRTKAADVVLVQSDARTSAGSPPAVVLTAVARAAVVVHHRPEDADLARRLLGALAATGATAGLAVRTLEMPAMRPDAIARVTYSDGALAGTAADIAKDANQWLAESDPGRPLLAASVSAPVVSRTIVIGLPDRAGTATSAGAGVPDVRGLNLGTARRALTAAGVTTVAYKLADDQSRKAFEVFDQQEVAGRTNGRMVVLQVAAKGTVSVYHLANDAPAAQRLARALQSHMNMYGILVRLVPQAAVSPDMVGKVRSAGTLLSREARTIATFTSNWFATELGRTVRIDAVTDPVGPPRLTFGFPPQ